MATQSSGTLAVSANATSLVVTGTFVLPYQISVSASWVTSFSFSGKGLASFTVNFGTPAPAGGGTLDWVVFSAPISSPLSGTGLVYALSDYLTQTRRLLRDASPGALYTDTDLTEFINRAIRQRDLDLGLNRLRVRFTLTSSTFEYSFNTILSGGTLLEGSANVNPYDVLSIIVIPLGGSTSAVRYPLQRWPYSKLAFMLSTTYPTYPMAYALYGPNTVIMGPPPAGNYVSEFDFMGYSSDLVQTTDQDSMPYPFSDPVPFLAAAFAKMQAQRFDEADKFSQTYAERLNRVRARSRSLSVAQPFSDLRR